MRGFVKSDFSNFRRVICTCLLGMAELTISQNLSPPFLFGQVFAPISKLIDLARWIKFNPSFITWLVLIVFSGTESNRRINFHPRLARFNPRLALIGFPGTGAWVLVLGSGRKSLLLLLVLTLRVLRQIVQFFS